VVDVVSRRLGFYPDLQSINSEETLSGGRDGLGSLEMAVRRSPEQLPTLFDALEVWRPTTMDRSRRSATATTGSGVRSADPAGSRSAPGRDRPARRFPGRRRSRVALAARPCSDPLVSLGYASGMSLSRLVSW
jgi:hypothetical protein